MASGNFLISRGKSAFFVCFLTIVLGVFFHSLKVAKISYSFGQFFFYFSFPLMIILLMLSLDKIRLSRVSISVCVWFFFVFIYSFLIGLVFNLDGDNYVDLVGDILRLCFSVLVLVSFSATRSRYLCNVEFLEAVAYVSLVSVIFGLFILYGSYFLGNGVYFGLQSTLALIPLAYGLVYRRYFLVLVSLLVIVMSGKRGVVVSVASIFFIYSFIYFFTKRRIVIVALGIFVFVFILLSIYLDLVPESIVSRFSMFWSEGDIDWHVATAARDVEVRAVIDQMISDPWKLWFGSGLGGVIYINPELPISTIHISPVAILFKFGIVGFVGFLFLFFCLFALFLIRSVRYSIANVAPYYVFWFLVFVGELAFSLTTYTIFQSFVLWLSVAMLQLRADKF